MHAVVRLFCCTLLGTAAIAVAAPATAAPGDPDTTFGPGGINTTAVGPADDFAYAAALQSDGKIVVGGTSSDGSSFSVTLIRYNSDGTVDTGFNAGGSASNPGIITTNIGPGNSTAYAMALQPDGKIVIAGSAVDATNALSVDFALARYDTDGSLDVANFNIPGQNGTITTPVGPDTDEAYAVALQADGGIIAAGYSNNGSNADFALTRYTTDGILDTTFGVSGIRTTDFGSGDDKIFGVAIQPDGKIVAAGYALNGTGNDFALARYTVGGALDTTFNPGGARPGTLTTDFGFGNDYAQAVALQPDGKIVAAGYANDGTFDDMAVARYNSDGSLDTGFNNGTGKVMTPLGSGNARAYAVVIQPDGKIVAAGYSTDAGNAQHIALVRYNADGTLDTTFAGTGTVIATLAQSTAKAALLQPDGGIIVAGYAKNSSDNDVAVGRYIALDTNWQITPDAFSFDDVNGVVAAGSVLTSNTIAISGLGTGVTVPVTVTGGQYAKNGSAAYTSQFGWATNGDTFALRQTAQPGTTATTLTVGGLTAPNNSTVVLGTAASDTFSSTSVSSGGSGAFGPLSLAVVPALYGLGRARRRPRTGRDCAR